jgi:hypothetical protein
MTPASGHQAQPAVTKITQRGRGGMLLTDTYVVARPVIFDMQLWEPANSRPGGTLAGSAPSAAPRG